jgi:hypothetical protein
MLQPRLQDNKENNKKYYETGIYNISFYRGSYRDP